MARSRRGACLAVLALLACDPGPTRASEVARAWEVMGTAFTVHAWGDDSLMLLEGVERAFDSVRRVDSLLSTYRDDSEITRINRGRGMGDGGRVSDVFAAVLAEALRVARLSDGAFDPTLQDWRGVAFDSVRRTVRMRPGLRLDFGGIAKGYALDRAALVLEGVADSVVLRLGGQLFVLTPTNSQPRATLKDSLTVARNAQRTWPVGIAHPDRPLDVMALIDLDRQRFSVSTSSQAERPGHIVDPRTGRAATRARLVTVVAPTGVAADAWSTALFVLGCDSALVLAARLGISTLCVDHRVRWTDDLDGRVALPTDSAARERGQ